MPPTPPDKLAFWGAILGAIIGTLGAFGVAYITVREDRKLAKEALDVERKKERKAREEEKRKEKERFEKEQLRSYGRRLFTYEVSLNGFIPILLKNERLLQQCIDAKEPGSFVTTLPRPTRLSVDKVGDLLNRELVDGWVTLSLRVELANQLLEDFVASYTELGKLVFTKLVDNDTTYNIPLVIQQKKDVLVFAESVKVTMEEVISDSKKLLAMLQLHGDISKSEDTKFRDRKVLEDYKLSSTKIQKRVDEISEKFDPEKVLSSPADRKKSVE